MATMVKSLAVEGMEGFLVEVEATVLKGQIPSMAIIGLPDQAIKEAGERVQAALQHDGYDLPKDKVIISLAPGSRRKRGSHYDLAIAVALLLETDQLAAKEAEHCGLIGELSLNGRIRPCSGILSMASEARKQGIHTLILPLENVPEAAAISGIEIVGVKTLQETVRYLESGQMPEQTILPDAERPRMQEAQMDFSDVKGQNDLVEAIVLGAAGGHNILMIGEPGCGKTMIAQRIPSILPEMTERESLEVTKIHSIANLTAPEDGILKIRPFRAPHHNISLNALIGGGSYAEPGEVSLANHGVLFLDELAEFSRSTLDALRQPLEDKKVTISRVNITNTYPANFMLVAAMNPCPCGYYPSGKCRCTDYEIMHYRGRISGPILERIDIQKNVRHVDYFNLMNEEPSPSSKELRRKVTDARNIQKARFAETQGVFCNAQMTTSMIRKYCILEKEAREALRKASEEHGYSARVIHKLLRLARTAADLDGQDVIAKKHIVDILSCRDLDNSNSQMYVIA